MGGDFEIARVNFYSRFPPMRDIPGKKQEWKESMIFFEQDPGIILLACMTGKTDGIGENLSEVIRGNIYAPEESVRPTDIEIEIEEIQGKIELTAKFKNSDDDVTMHYDKGLSIQK